MILKPISMAQLSGIGVSSVLGPGDSLPYGVVLGKRVIIGRFRAGPKGEWEHFQYWLTQKLIAKDGPLCGTHAMLGKHHFGVSWALRLLGVNVGKRVFWPGVELKVVEFDLLTVGD